MRLYTIIQKGGDKDDNVFEQAGGEAESVS